MKSTVCKQDKGERMDIDALRQAHEKLKRKSQRQRDRIKELEEELRKVGNYLDESGNCGRDALIVEDIKQLFFCNDDL
jgi:cell division septum initiation protein DivIVA